VDKRAFFKAEIDPGWLNQNILFIHKNASQFISINLIHTFIRQIFMTAEKAPPSPRSAHALQGVG
jgi:hypothetical protein